MKPLELRTYLYDIAQACDLLIQFIFGKTLKDYSSDALLRSAVERQFEIIGEALNRALRLDSNLAYQISDTRRIYLLSQSAHSRLRFDLRRGGLGCSRAKPA